MGQLLFAFRYLFASGFQFLTRRGKLGFLLLESRLLGGNFLFCRLKLASAADNSTASALQLLTSAGKTGLPGLQFFLCRLKLPRLFLQLGAALRKLLASALQFFLSVSQLLLTVLKLFFRIRQPGSGIVNLLLAIVNLFLSVFHNLIISGLAADILDFSDPVLNLIHQIFIFIAVADFPLRLIHRQINR